MGWGTSSHTHSWIELLAGSTFDVRLFALPARDLPPDDWQVPAYISGVPPRPLDPSLRKTLYPVGRIGWLVRRIRGGIAGDPDRVVERWLAGIVRRWRPHVVHTFGLDPAGFLYDRVRRELRQSGRQPAPVWVLQLRGGSDLTLARHDPQRLPALRAALHGADEILSDNTVNSRYIRELGAPEAKLSSLTPVPGTGGLDVDAVHATATTPPARRRLILWPKAYEARWSKALPVIEALRSAWPGISPCSIHMLAADLETRSWVRTLPGELQSVISVEGRVPRKRTLALMAQARVMLAPSLIDGTPNTMFEAMTAGALPIVSPLDTISSVVRDSENVLFARNLYPDEIAAALARAMSDDVLVDRAAATNLERVRELADRAAIRPRVVAYYQQLAHRAGAENG